MKKVLYAIVAIVCVSFLANAEHKFAGPAACKPCHQGEKKGKQFEIWNASAHAGAYKSLLSPKAAEVAKKKGLTKPAAESPECLACHATGSDTPALAEKIKKEDGVSCEACHGAGADYKGMAVMKDKVKAAAAGMILGKDEPKVCTVCHNEKSPTFKGFVYKEMYEKVKHQVPAK